MYRTGERFGQAHFISVLLGEQDERIGASATTALHFRHRQGARPQRMALDRAPARRARADIGGCGGPWRHVDLAEGRQFLREKPPLTCVS
jgi:ATP-dependent DNA helicase RecQ